MSDKLRYREKEVIVTKLFSFDAAHRLEEYEGKCAHLHGHTYRLEVSVRGIPDDRGIVLDFADLKQMVNEHIISKYDHQFLNDHFSFNTTAENLVIFFFEVIDQALQRSLHGSKVRLWHVRLWETPSSCAEIDREAFFSEGK